LVGGLIDIAMITRQVATAVNLENELAQWNRRIAHATLARQIAEANCGVGTEAEDPGRTRCITGTRVTGTRAGTCPSGTPPRFNTGDETAEPSSVDLIAPAPQLDAR
jgi:hypothetical protein